MTALHRQLSLVLLALLALPACKGSQSLNLSDELNVKPDINQRWKSDEIGPLINTLETESREIYTERSAIASVVGPKPGAVIADIGAGSGFMTHLFSLMVGDQGWVYAVDINSTMLGHIAEGAKERGLKNIQTITCTQKSVELPPSSVDIVFICDTYHHFEYPRNTLHSIYTALRPGGQLVLVDFKRVEGETPEWIMNHVRAGRGVFTSEIEAAGFELTNQHDLEALTDNYILRFRKQADSAK
ncbi:MAG: putative methyltransferase [Planctomycetota bacterium]|jgi:predicted methyltransferase